MKMCVCVYMKVEGSVLNNTKLYTSNFPQNNVSVIKEVLLQQNCSETPKVKLETRRLHQHWDKCSKLVQQRLRVGHLVRKQDELVEMVCVKEFVSHFCCALLRFSNMTLLHADADILKCRPRNNAQEFCWNILDNMRQRHKHGSASKQEKKRFV